MGPFAGVAISCMYLVLASLFLEMISVAELQLLTMGLSDMGFLCVFFSKVVLFLVYFVCFHTFPSDFVDVLDKGCWVINIQFYVGCCVCKMVKSYLCVSVPVLDDDCGAFAALFMMTVSSMISFFRTCLCVYVRLSFRFLEMMSTSPLMSSTMFIISVSSSSLLFLLHLMQNDPSEAGQLTSISRCILNLGLAFTIV